MTPYCLEYTVKVLDADIKHGQQGHCLLNSLLGVKKMEFPYMGISGTPHPSDSEVYSRYNFIFETNSTQKPRWMLLQIELTGTSV